MADASWADVSFSVVRGTLKVAWSGSRAARAANGNPRFTRLAPGRASIPLFRVYGGFGYVWENPRRFILKAGAFGLSTRHAGMDFANGLSLAVAVDAPPDALEVDGAAGRASLVTHNDAAFFFTPSAAGAFGAARRFAAASGYSRSPGFAALAGRMCIDSWSGLYLHEAECIRRAAKYGVCHAVYLQHRWQRWGYDIRLPDVYPPSGDFDEFHEMVGAAKSAGMLFGVHDNYVDLYRDSSLYSEDRICYNPDGTPQEAWCNPAAKAKSYRWLPSAILPAIERNLPLMRNGFAPTALFLDVFGASFPKDSIDRRGTFRPADACRRDWCAAVDACRRASGVTDLAIVTESGNDALIGHIDAGESDHYPPEFVVQDARQYDAVERVPWHDAVSHGKMILFGGGLGSRYCMRGWGKPGDVELHGYATDDYFCTTVAGGRAPMCGNACDRGAVSTYWLLHGVCETLAAGDFTGCEFAGGIHRQHVTFSTGEVWINRATGMPWKVEGRMLPECGFYVRGNDGREAGVTVVDGIRSAFAKDSAAWFVDARPPASDGKIHEFEAEVTGWTKLSDVAAKISVRWNVVRQVPSGFIAFAHVVPLASPGKIAFNAVLGSLPEGSVSVHLPKTLSAGEYAVRFGYFRKTGERLPIGGYGDGQGRVRGGILTVVESGGRPSIISWRAERRPSRAKDLGWNVERRLVDFGGIRTDGAFRLLLQDMQIVPLPGSGPFRAEFDLARLGTNGHPSRIRLVDPAPDAETPVLLRNGSVLSVSFDAKAFAYILE